MGLILPTHPSFTTTSYKPDIVPPRLVNNQQSGYANICTWTDHKESIKNYIQDDFDARISKSSLRNNTRNQFKKIVVGGSDD